MEERQIEIRHKSTSSGYLISVTSAAIDKSGEWAVKCLGGPARKAVIVSNPTVFGLYGEKVRRTLNKAGFEVSTFLMKDGERYKNLRSLEAVLKHLTEQR